MLRIKGGKVYDPANNINGVVKDICIDNGRIVADAPGGRDIDATGMIVFPGGVDIHTHVAGAALNFARAMTPENQRVAAKFLHTPERRMGIGGPTPTTFATGYLYAGMGYTTVVEAAVPVLSAKHTHEELRDTPIVDKACCVLMANNEIVHGPARSGRIRAGQGRRRLADLGGQGLRRQGGQSRRRHRLEVGQGRQAAVTSRSMATAKSRRRRSSPAWRSIVDELGLPHPMHLHCNNLGAPGNVATTLETMKVLEGNRGPHGPSAVPRLRRRRLAHDALRGRRRSPTISTRIRISPPTPAPSCSATPSPSPPTAPGSTCSTNSRAASGATSTSRTRPAAASCPTPTRAATWSTPCNGRSAWNCCCLIDDPWRIFLTTDHPNGACFWRYPEIIHLLMNADCRSEAREEAAGQGAERASCWPTSTASIRCTKSRSSPPPARRGRSA